MLTASVLTSINSTGVGVRSTGHGIVYVLTASTLTDIGSADVAVVGAGIAIVCVYTSAAQSVRVVGIADLCSTHVEVVAVTQAGTDAGSAAANIDSCTGIIVVAIIAVVDI